MDPIRNNLTDLKIDKLCRILDLFRVYDKDIPTQLVSTFLYIAAHENCHKQALEDPVDGLGLSTAAASRNTDALAKVHRLERLGTSRKKGLNLIIKEVDNSVNPRRVQLKLTREGSTLVKNIKSILNEKA